MIKNSQNQILLLDGYKNSVDKFGKGSDRSECRGAMTPSGSMKVAKNF